MRTTSPSTTNTMTPMSMGIFESSSSEPFSGTMVAIMASTSSMAGMASITYMSLPLKGNVNTRLRFGSTLRIFKNAGNIGM